MTKGLALIFPDCEIAGLEGRGEPRRHEGCGLLGDSVRTPAVESGENSCTKGLGFSDHLTDALNIGIRQTGPRG